MNPAPLEARFLAVVSHELRTPLTTIASFAESLDDGDLGPGERPVALAAVRRTTDRMLALLDDLHTVGRLHAGDLTPAAVPVDPGGTVGEAAALLAARDAGTVTVHAEPGPPLTGDPALLRDLAYGVLGALAGAAADRRARAAVAPSAGGWTVTVTAPRAGPLTDEALMAAGLPLPGPPYRRRSAALWLLLADAVALRHGGTVRVHHRPGTGALAVVRLTGSS